MASNFRKLLNEGTKEKQIRDYKLRLQLCESCLAYMRKGGNKNNKGLYDALSHLAEIPELEINLAEYDDYEFTAKGLEFDPDFYVLVRNKRNDALLLIQSLIEEQAKEDGL